jgi:hypothetical protein
MATRDPGPVPSTVPHTIKDPVKYVSPLTAYQEYERNKTNAATPAAETSPATEGVAEAEPDMPTGPVTVKLLYVGPGSKPENADTTPATPDQSTPAEKVMAARAALLAEAKLAVEAAEAVLDERSKRAKPAHTPGANEAEDAIAPKRSHHKQKRPKRKPRPNPTANRSR